MIADMVVDTQAARSLVWKAAWLKDSGQPNTLETSVAKLFSTEAAIRSANAAIQVHGGSGYVDDYPWSATCATRGSRPCTRAPRRSRSSSSGGR